jgi:hypothetical protein
MTGSWSSRIRYPVNVFKALELVGPDESIPHALQHVVEHVSLSGTWMYFCGHEAGQCYVCASARHANCTKAKIYGPISHCLYSSKGLVGNYEKASGTETHLPTG